MRKRVSLEDLDNIAGGKAETADTYLLELYKKYGGSKLDEVLAKATREEVDHFNQLFYNWSIFP